MPATSVQQRRFFGWAEHHPEQAKAEGKYPKGMSRSQMSDFASTPESGLPKRKFYGEDGGHWIGEATSKPSFKKGALTAEAKSAGMAPMAFARKHYGDSGKVGARSRFAINANK